MLSNKETQLGHFEANYSICGVSIKVRRSYFRKQLVPLKGSFAGSWEQPGEINLARFKSSGLTVLNLLSLQGSDQSWWLGQAAPLAWKQHRIVPSGMPWL